MNCNCIDFRCLALVPRLLSDSVSFFIVMICYVVEHLASNRVSEHVYSDQLLAVSSDARFEVAPSRYRALVAWYL